MAVWMWILLVMIICQRIVELIIAKSNEKWMKERGGIEKGKEHYKWFLLLHFVFFCSIIIEAITYERNNVAVNLLMLTIFIIVQIGRFWCIYSLGRFWNTKIIVLPRVALIKKGPYKFMKHPNYLIVGIELFVIPILFAAYTSAIIFPLLHILLLKIRIPREEKALAKANFSKP